MKIWERHLLHRLLVTLLFIFGSLCLLFFCIDLSMHSVRFFSSGKTHLFDLCRYYLYSISGYIDLFFALSFLLATLKVLFDLLHRHETVALQMAGISCRQLTRPFLYIAAALSLLSYANAEWISPKATEVMDSFRKDVSKRKKSILRKHLQTATLKDDSELVYQEYNASKKELLDVFWIRSVGDIWHIKRLELQGPTAHFTDHFIRENNELKLLESFEQREFAELSLDLGEATKTFTPFEHRPLALLLLQAFSTHCADLPMIRSHLHYKLSLPLFPLLFATLLPPFLLGSFSRNRPTFFITACCLLGLVCFLTFLDSLLILSENQMTHPCLSLWTPWIFAFGIAIYRLIK